MEQEALIKPKVFISYSWSNADYQEWVIDLAKRLVHDGVDVVIDVWDLVEGHDKYVFMEQMVKSEDIDKVLIMCDEKYKNRADERKGGVGDETQIISSNVYQDVNQEKFIPIIATRDENGDSFTPNYIRSRIYIDLSDGTKFEESYEQLLRNIFKVPLHQKPELGSPPSYLFEKEVDHFQTSVLIKRMHSLIDRQPNRLESIAIDFEDKFMDSLDQFAFEYIEGKELDDIIVDNIERMLPLRDDYISMMQLLCDSGIVSADYIVDFFEQVYAFSEHRGGGVFTDNQFDHYKFFIHELFLHTIILLLRFRKYEVISIIVNADYYVESRYHNDRALTYDSFRFYAESLRDRNIRLKLNKISITADLLVRRADKYKKELVEADLLLYYISEMRAIKLFTWFPVTYFYFKSPFRLVSRMKSERHFELVKKMFNVDSKEDFIEKAGNIQRERGYYESFQSIPSLRDFIDLHQIASHP